MKRGSLKRRTPLRPGTEPAKPRKPLPKANRARLRKRFAEQFDSPAFVAWVHEQPCAGTRLSTQDEKFRRAFLYGLMTAYGELEKMIAERSGE